MKICKKLSIILTILIVSFAFAHPCFSSDASSSAPRGTGSCGRDKSNTGGDGNDSCGSPTWSVNMVNLNLYVLDVPLWYNPPVGPSINIALSYNTQVTATGTEPFGNKWQFSYGSSLTIETGNNVLIVMPDGKKDLFTDNGSGGYDKPYGIYNTLTKIGTDHFELTLPNDTVYVYQIPSGTSASHPYLTQIRDAHGQSVIISYNSSTQPATITDALGRTTTLSYTADKVTSVTDPFGRTALFEYDGNQNLTKITDMGGYWTSLTYDGNSYLTQMEDGKGVTQFYIEPSDAGSTIQYPAPGGAMQQNYRITVTDPMDNKQEFYYSGLLGYGWHVSPNDYVEYVDSVQNNGSANVPKTKYHYENTDKGIREEIKTITTTEGDITAYTYDTATGKRISVADASGNTVEYAYNDMGLVTYIKDAKEVETDLTYDTNNVDLLEIRTYKGAQTYSNATLVYNTTHDVTSITDVLSTRTTGIDYNSYGQITNVTDALTIVASNTYNANHQLTQVLRDSKVVQTNTYDALDRVRTTTDATGMMLTYDYNNLNHITKVTYPDGKYVTKTYSSCCPRVVDAITDRNGKTINFTYDALKRLTNVFDKGQTQFDYDFSGNLVQLIDANQNATTYEYDNNNRLIKKINANGKFESYEYNTSSLLSLRTDARNIQTSYYYDENKNLTNVSYSDMTPQILINYDDFNRITDIQDGTGITNFTYHPDSLLATIDGPLSNDNITYTYDDLGRRIGMAADLGQAHTYAYDNLNRLTSVQTGAGDFTYAYKSNVSPMIDTLTRPNLSSTTYTYDAVLNRLTSISNKNSSAQIINQYDYTYDKDRIASETITDGEPITTFQEGLIQYDHNNVNQLVKTIAPEKLFNHDDAGNMTQGYTPEGYMFTATYDAENRLKTIEYIDNTAINHKIEYIYAYNSFVAQIKKYENTTLVSDTSVIRDGLLALQERDAANTVNREYTWGINRGGGIGGLLNLKQNAQNYSYLYDGKGNITAVTDTAQALSAAYRYDAFGVLMTKAGTLDQPFTFSTKRYDSSTGLNYYGYRFYSPQIGKWMTRDPIGLAGGINLYGFVLNDPVNFIDPTGEFAITGTVLAIWAIAELGMSIYDAYDTVSTLADPCSTSFDKGAVIGGLMLGAVLPGGGYGKLTKSVNKMAKKLGVSDKAIRDAIHKVKKNLPKSGPIKNPDVKVDLNTGEVYPIVKGSKAVGDSIGNIFDHLN